MFKHTINISTFCDKLYFDISIASIRNLLENYKSIHSLIVVPNSLV